jgi:hypothetical protein
MNKFLDSLKSDLLDRRLLPLLGLLGVGLIAAIAYAALAGSGSSATTTSAATAASTPAAGIAVSAVKTEGEPGSGETTSGEAKSSGATHDPFARGGAAKSASTSSPASTPASSGSESASTTPGGSTSGSSESGSGSKSSSPSNGGESSPAKPAPKPKQPRTSYEVNVLFGATTAGTPALSANLQTFTGLQRQQPLPSAKDALVVFSGVMAGGKSATFTIVGEVILRGAATCLPSAEQCQAIELKEGQTEELEVGQPGTTPSVYELYVLAVKQSTSSVAAAAASSGQSKSGLQVLRDAGVPTLPGLRYSTAKGVLVFASDRAFAARADAVAQQASPSR